jgi:V-type H+-transporting ATPase subunit E
LLHSGKVKLQEEYTKKDKDLEIEQRVAKSTAISNVRVNKMESRDKLLDDLKSGALDKLKAFTKNKSAYGKLIKDLIVQGLFKMKEGNVEIQCRPEDDEIVTAAIPEAKRDIEKVFKGQLPEVVLSDNKLDSNEICGGVVMCARGNRIIVDQTLDERLGIAYKDQLPVVRKMLFSEIV